MWDYVFFRKIIFNSENNFPILLINGNLTKPWYLIIIVALPLGDLIRDHLKTDRFCEILM